MKKLIILVAFVLLGCNDPLNVGNTENGFPTFVNDYGQTVIYVEVRNVNQILNKGKIVTMTSFAWGRYGTSGYIVVFEKGTTK